MHNKLRINQSGKLSVMYFKTEIIITYDTSLLNTYSGKRPLLGLSFHIKINRKNLLKSFKS